MTLPARCKKCGSSLDSSLEIAIHLGRLGEQGFAYSGIYPYAKRCPELARKRDIGN